MDFEEAATLARLTKRCAECTRLILEWYQLVDFGTIDEKGNAIIPPESAEAIAAKVAYIEHRRAHAAERN